MLLFGVCLVLSFLKLSNISDFYKVSTNVSSVFFDKVFKPQFLMANAAVY